VGEKSSPIYMKTSKPTYKPEDNGARPIGYDTRDDFEQSRDDLNNEGID